MIHISVPRLCGEAGGDPWQLDQTLQGGDPGQIAELSRAFFNAGDCTSESYQDFVDAQQRFRAAWSRETGEHPINDSAEVQRAQRSLTFQREQIPTVAATLAGIAAALAEAQRSSSREISALDAKLRVLDELIGRALARRRNPSTLEDNAIEATRSTVDQVRSLRDGYSAELDRAKTTLQLDCDYDPAIEDVDGDGGAGSEQRGRDSVEYYNSNQRSHDEAVVRGGGPLTVEQFEAARRLSDYGVATDPNAGEEARALAAERLDDFRMAKFTGPLPEDPVLGQNPRTRARSRLELQHQLESGAFGLPPMTRDEATRELDDGEHFGRVAAVQQAMFGLTRCGMSREGARSVVWNWAHQGSDFADKAGLGTGGIQAYADAVPTGTHARPGGLLSAEDAAKWSRIAGRAGTAGNLVQFGVAVAELAEGGEHKREEFGEAAGGLAGGWAGGWGAALAAGSVTGPWTTAALVVAASFLGSQAGSGIGGGIGSSWDRAVAPAGRSG